MGALAWRRATLAFRCDQALEELLGQYPGCAIEHSPAHRRGGAADFDGVVVIDLRPSPAGIAAPGPANRNSKRPTKRTGQHGAVGRVEVGQC